MRKIPEIIALFLIITLVAFVVFAYAGMTEAATAEEWPAKDITLIIPTSPGGGYDILARATAPIIEKYLPKKTNVVCKNVIGAAGKIGTMETLRAKPDGYTICIGDPIEISAFQMGGQLKELDVLRISWLGRLDNLPYLLLVGTGRGFKHPNEMKGKLVRFATTGAAQTLSIAAVNTALEAKTRVISYDGTSPASIALMQGDIDAYLVNWPSAMRAVRASEGKITPLFVCEKVAELKEILSADELGIKFDRSVSPLLGYSHILFAPANLPVELKRIWGEVLNRVYKDPEWLARMSKIGIPSSGGLTGEHLMAVIAESFKTVERFKNILLNVGNK